MALRPRRSFAVLLQSEVSQISISLARLHVHDAKVWDALLPALLQHSNLPDLEPSRFWKGAHSDAVFSLQAASWAPDVCKSFHGTSPEQGLGKIPHAKNSLSWKYEDSDLSLKNSSKKCNFFKNSLTFPNRFTRTPSANLHEFTRSQSPIIESLVSTIRQQLSNGHFDARDLADLAWSAAKLKLSSGRGENL